MSVVRRQSNEARFCWCMLRRVAHSSDGFFIRQVGGWCAGSFTINGGERVESVVKGAQATSPPKCFQARRQPKNSDLSPLSTVRTLQKDLLTAHFPDWNPTPDDGVYRSLTNRSLPPAHLASLEPANTCPGSAATIPRAPAPPSIPNLASLDAILFQPCGPAALAQCLLHLLRGRSDPRSDWGRRAARRAPAALERRAVVHKLYGMQGDARLYLCLSRGYSSPSFPQLPKAADQEPGLPNSDYGSDHAVCLMAELELY
ncbi:hypothetical protein DFJ77DRAFT_441202 [Powellomyces hirtus]|nr:hypothetical protein DFJ77DRAFT_441202 [Powellomyces hirtus]